MLPFSKVQNVFYSNIENLVLPPGCRPYGPEAGPGHRKLAWPLRKPWSDGILECWNTGFGGIRSFLCSWQRPENKISPASAFDPQYSIIPWVLERPTPPLRGGVKPRLRRGLWTRIFIGVLPSLDVKGFFKGIILITGCLPFSGLQNLAKGCLQSFGRWNT